jgi:hypothetical protein
MPVKATAASATTKWLTNLTAAQTSMKTGAMAVQTSPGLLASQAADKWLNRVTAAKQKFITNSANVTLQQWQNAYTNIGISRAIQGAQSKQSNVTAFQNQFLPYLQQGVAKIDAMPKNTLQDGVARAVAMINYNAQFKYNKGAAQ